MEHTNRTEQMTDRITLENKKLSLKHLTIQKYDAHKNLETQHIHRTPNCFLRSSACLALYSFKQATLNDEVLHHKASKRHKFYMYDMDENAA